MLSQYQHLEAIPTELEEWTVKVRGARRLHENFTAHREDAFLYRRLTRLCTDVPLQESVADLKWKGPRENFLQFCQMLGASDLPKRLPSALI